MKRARQTESFSRQRQTAKQIQQQRKHQLIKLKKEQNRFEKAREALIWFLFWIWMFGTSEEQNFFFNITFRYNKDLKGFEIYVPQIVTIPDKIKPCLKLKKTKTEKKLACSPCEEKPTDIYKLKKKQLGENIMNDKEDDDMSINKTIRKQKSDIKNRSKQILQMLNIPLVNTNLCLETFLTKDIFFRDCRIESWEDEAKYIEKEPELCSEDECDEDYEDSESDEDYEDSESEIDDSSSDEFNEEEDEFHKLNEYAYLNYDQEVFFNFSMIWMMVLNVDLCVTFRERLINMIKVFLKFYKYEYHVKYVQALQMLAHCSKNLVCIELFSVYFAKSYQSVDEFASI